MKSYVKPKVYMDSARRDLDFRSGRALPRRNAQRAAPIAHVAMLSRAVEIPCESSNPWTPTF
ncbi:MAG TPA: hypothetical protein VK456_13415 [Xanthobacteraceae bacterium]|nr:hypothetical protein [Xanthobacteraceae bacterium]